MQNHQLSMKSVQLPMLLLAAVAILFTPTPQAGWQEGLAASKAGDHEKALQELMPLAEQGHGSAQSMIGVMYFNGEGVEQDFGVAHVWLTLAANQGYSLAQYNLGVMYDSGQGVEQDFDEAFKWYGLAARQGHSSAQYNLGAMYSDGDGVKQDLKRAYMWFHISAVHGNQQAVEQRKALEKEMTAQQITAAKQMTSTCMESRYEEC